MRETRPLIIYLQYTNPAGYPPLEHSSRMLADAGWDVLFLGASGFGAGGLEFPPHPSIVVRKLAGYGDGLRQKLNFATFLAWVGAICGARRPAWIYASDAMSCPAALTARAACGARLIYHEHDTPLDRAPVSALKRLIHEARRRVARSADVCVLPQQRRLETFIHETGRGGPTLRVWNCPRKDEVRGLRAPLQPDARMSFYYHGSLNPERLPFSVVEALARLGGRAKLVVVGYETVGSRGYVSELMRRASEAGVERGITYLGPMRRGDMMAAAADGDVGFAFMPPSTNDLNMTYMTGASNKPFDYLAVGQSLLVSKSADWRDMFVTPGYAHACNPYDAADLGAAMSWCVANPEAVRASGEAGRQRILSEWNYERCFAPVLEVLRHDTGRSGASLAA